MDLRTCNIRKYRHRDRISKAALPWNIISIKGTHAKNQGFRMLTKSLRNALNRSCTVLSVRICGHTAGCIREML